MVQQGVIKNSIVYIISNILLKSFNFLLLPLYTNYLITSDYGIINIASNFYQVCCFIVALSLYTAVNRFYADLKVDRNKIKRLFGTMVCFTFCSGVVAFILFVAFRGFLIRFVFAGIPFFPTTLLILGTLVFMSTYTMYQDIVKAMQDAKRSAVTTLSFFFTQLSLNIIFIVVLRLGANGVLVANLIVYSIFSAWMLIDLKKRKLFEFCIDKNILKPTLTYSMPLLPHDLSTHFAQLISKIFLNNWASISTVGVFSLAYQLGNVAELIQVSVNTAFMPWFFHHMNKQENGYKNRIIQLSSALVWLYGLLFIGLSLFSQEVILIMANQGYAEAWKVVPFVVSAFVIKIPCFFFF
jgi:O-antigen/teichoic acid export membrane protein